MAFAVSTVIAGVGLAIGAAGLYENVTSAEKAAKANAAAAGNQAQIAGLQAGNVDVQKQELDLQAKQQKLQIQTNDNVIELQSQSDSIRQQAAELDATRRRREAVRQGIVARSQSLVAAANQGASSPGSTALRQSQNSITSGTDQNILAVNQNLGAGAAIFNINKQITAQYLNAQAQNSTYVDQSHDLQSKSLDTQKQVYALGGAANNDYASAALAQGNAALGAGMMSLGATVSNAYPTINRLTSYFGSSSSNPYYGPLDNNG
jgi:hypothetical protein